MAVPEERGGRVAPEERAARSSAAEYSQRHDPEWVRAGRELLSASDVGRTIARMAHQIIEKTALDSSDPEAPRVVLIGIPTRGTTLAARLTDRIEEFSGVRPALGSLDITLYRDDLQTIGPRPVVGATTLPAEIDGVNVVIVDDVLYTGRTIRAALDELADFGRPARISLAVLIDRGGRELPIQPDIVGKTVAAKKGDRVDVLVEELDGKTGVVLVSAAAR